MFFDSAFRASGETAVMTSPFSAVVESDTSPTCLTFNYVMYEGPPNSVFNVYLRFKDGDSETRKLLWTKSGERNCSWRHVALHVEPSKDGYFDFEGVTGLSRTLLGLDNVGFSPCFGNKAIHVIMVDIQYYLGVSKGN